MTELANIIRIPSRIGTGWGFAVVLLGVIAILTPFLSGMAVSGLLAVVVMAAGSLGPIVSMLFKVAKGK